MAHRTHQLITKHDWIEIKSDLKLAGEAKVKILNHFKLSAGDSFVITEVDGDLTSEYDGLNEGDSAGRFKSEHGGRLDLFVTYQGGDGNDIELYTKPFFGVLPDSLSETRIIGSDADDSLTGTSADEVIFGANGNDVLLGGGGDDQVTGGNGDDKLDGGLEDDTLKGDCGADNYILSSGENIYESFSIDENDQAVVGKGVDLSFRQVGDNLLIKGVAIHSTLLDVDKNNFLAADYIDYI
ncbi:MULTISPECIES: calcium-binding protein [unclassified Prochlorococcus]|uniref:calcium-binding protein n=1 Tax=unclassified Prochlorococcus TaxID=2627481 RepID=UPI0005339659|nr:MULTISPECIES: calcium-binding protein [unclassified Prochlorococcus]KGG26604.1 hemolysin-type calcium binding protein [Prochlorococcus sp. MIT 0701]KGG30159.1 hemolysin-type calcium binding protein [Prochlorococcus sp. MIT 0702]KGG33186.1 hemolysin-type calcium binding protein [Prochlorococcus sp. MIT 0703]